MLKIAITGGIGSGKTYVSRLFRIYDIPVYHADREAKRLMNQNRELKTQIKQLLGAEAYHKNGRLNRAFIASKIFNDSKLLNRMNQLVHPVVRDDFEKWAHDQRSSYVLEESAIIFEAGLAQYFDAVILVVAEMETRISRVMERDKISRQDVLNRMKNQKPDKFKMKLADFIILNDHKKSLLHQVEAVHKEILKLRENKSHGS